MNKLVLRPKYQLDHAQIQGDRITIPAHEFTELTGRTYPYPRLGTRAPNSNPGNNPGSIVRMPYGYVRDGRIVKAVAGLKPHYTLDKAVVQGVMPASAYQRLTGKLTTAPRLPARGTSSVAMAPARAPALFDWGTFVGGALAGGILTILLTYGVIPALAEWGVREIGRR